MHERGRPAAASARDGASVETKQEKRWGRERKTEASRGDGGGQGEWLELALNAYGQPAMPGVVAI